MTIAAVLEAKGKVVETITAEARMIDAVAMLGEKRIGALPVVDGQQIIGIISERDVIYCLREHGPGSLEWPIGKIMSAPAITVAPELDVLSALALMTKRRVRHLPVVDESGIRGIVSIGDLVKRRIEHIEAEAEAMRAYIQG